MTISDGTLPIDTSGQIDYPARERIGWRLNVLSSESGPDIDAVADVLQREKVATDEGEVAIILQSNLLDSLDPDTLDYIETGHQAMDLIGHSRQIDDDIYLTIGDWTITQTEIPEFARRMRPLLQKKAISKLRLLGCETATTDGGWAVIQAIAHELGIVVYGTNTSIAAHENFGRQGFKSYLLLHPSTATHKASSQDFFPQARLTIPLNSEKLRQEDRPSTSGALSTIIESDLLAAQIWAGIEPGVAWSLPGLLGRPVQEVLIRGDGDKFHRVQILLKYQTVRVFPGPPYDRYGLVYQVNEPATLKQLLSSPR